MSDQAEPRVFTSTVEASYASELRARRDRTDAQIAGEFPLTPSSERIARARQEDASSRRFREKEAMVEAVQDVTSRWWEYARDTERATGAAIDFDGVSVTVTLSDLVATAVLTDPTPRI